MAIVVDIPATAAAGSVADLVLRLRTGDTVTLTRFLVEVDPDAVRDDSALASEYEVRPGKDSPAMAMAPLVALAALGWAARRARR